jgi:hypothetical protein
MSNKFKARNEVNNIPDDVREATGISEKRVFSAHTHLHSASKQHFSYDDDE